MNKLDANFNFHQTALNLRAQRQEVLASNLANADTPNYKARDFDFSAKLKDAVGKIASPSGILGTAAAVAGGAAALASLPATLASGGVAAAAKSLATTAAMHIGFGKDQPDSALSESEVKYRETPQGSVDGNTVDADVERNQFADNALRYEASLTILRNDIQKMLAVLQP
jgi:flagellar basal-body rod protein FlgB